LAVTQFDTTFMKKTITITLLALTIISCNNRQDKIAVLTNDTTKSNKISAQEKELPYFDSTTMTKTGEEGYQDTFSVDNIKFRILHHDNLYDGIVQKFNNGQWSQILNFENLGNHNDYYVNKDLNNDGYNDICLEWKWDMETFFYDTKLKTFSKKSLRLSSNWALIDKTKGIYCNYQDSKTADATSELYIIKNFDKVVLGYIDFKAREDDNQVLDKVTLYNNRTKIEELNINKDEEFDYRKWWTENYRRVL